MLCSTCAQVLQVDLFSILDNAGNAHTDLEEREMAEIAWVRGSGLHPAWGGESQSPQFEITGTIAEFQAGIQQNCHICWERFSQLSIPDKVTIWNAGNRSISTYYLGFFHSDDTPRLLLHVMFVEESGGSHSGIGSLHVFEFHGWTDEYHRSIAVNSTVEHPTATDYAGLINYWITTCEKDHVLCARAGKRYDIQPKRILCISKDPNDGDSVKCHLQVTEEAPWCGKYLTLSHRWGQGVFLRLTTSNLDDFKQSIPIDQLPQVFRDSMSLALAMGMSYLWIDSLCIVQDSESDWHMEAPNMHAIYCNSHFNIAAASDNSTSQLERGLFASRQVDLVQPCLVKHQFPTLPTSHKAWKDDPLLILVSWNLGSRAVDRSKLYSRAWTLQERVLAPRVGNFCKDQLFWECAEMQACETLPKGWGRQNGEGTLKGMASHLHHETPDPIMLKRSWLEMIEKYSEKEMTKPGDRLPALSGLATLYSDLLQEEYLAGLWKDDLTHQLLWMRDSLSPSREGRRRGLSYTGPSWSWSSLGSPISALGYSRTHDIAYIPLAIVNHSLIVPKSESSTGEVLKGTINLSAHICPFATFASTLCNHHGYSTTGPALPAIQVGMFPVMQFFAHCSGDANIQMARTIIVPDSDGALASATHTMPLEMAFRIDIEDLTTVTIRGLLLELIDSPNEADKTTPCFRRRGYYAGSSTRQGSNVLGARWDFEHQEMSYTDAYFYTELDLV